MIDKLKNTFQSLEKQTKTIIKNGVKFCFMLCIISLIFLLTYDFGFSNPLFFEVGIALFKISLLFSIEFLICGIVVDSLKKNLI